MIAEPPEPDLEEIASALRVSLGMMVRRLRQVHDDDELTLPESSLLARLDRGGPATASALARLERISPQSAGATLAGLELRGLIRRVPDPDDGRRVILSITESGLRLLWNRRNARTQWIANALATGFTPAEVERLAAAAPLLERLAQSG